MEEQNQKQVEALERAHAEANLAANNTISELRTENHQSNTRYNTEVENIRLEYKQEVDKLEISHQNRLESIEKAHAEVKNSTSLTVAELKAEKEKLKERIQSMISSAR